MGSPVISLTENSNNSTVSLKMGESLEIVLPGNPSTGYSWLRPNFSSPSGGKTKPKLSCENFNVSASFKSEGTKGMLGVGGSFIITVIPKTVGRHKLDLVYARVFEGPQSTEKDFVVWVDVTSA